MTSEWQRLREQLVPYIGERAVSLLSYAIADASGDEQASARLRSALIDSGEDPDAPQVTEAEQLLIDWGRSVAGPAGEVPAGMTARLEAAFKPQLRALLAAFAAQR
ncbi:MAG: hypothetical protein WA006_10545 [Rhodoglobus sp.]